MTVEEVLALGEKLKEEYGRHNHEKFTEGQKLFILAAKFQFVITDPYPEVSLWLNAENARGAACGLFSMFQKPTPKPIISPHKAWTDGFNFAWSLVEKKLNE